MNLLTLFIGAIFITCLMDKNAGPAGEKFSWAERFKALLGLGETLIIFALVVGGIFYGLFTPTEGGAFAAIYAIVVCMLYYRELSVRELIRVSARAARTSRRFKG